MIRILLLMLFMMHAHASNTVSSKTNKLSNNINYPRYLSFKQFSLVLKFDQYEHFEQPQEVGTLTSNDQWQSKMLKYWNGDSELEKYSTSFTSKSRSDENRAQQLHPFLLCHLDKTSASGTQRYNHIQEEISKENSSNLDFHVNELPVFNYNFNFNINKNQNQRAEQEKEIEKDEETIYGACFYGSMSNIMARNIKGDNIFATPILPDLKIRRGTSMTNKKNGNNNQNTKAISVRLSPGVATSDDNILELAYSFVDNFDSLPEDYSESTCSDNTQLTSSTISVSSTDTSTFSYSLEHNKDEDEVIRDECLLYFIEYLSKQPKVLSVERVNKTKQLNDVASWIIQGYTEENNRPWFDIGIRGEGEIVQLLDSGIDESHCYLKDKSDVPLTTDYDLTGGRIDLTKRKIVQYVAMNGFNGDREDETSHGTHVATTLAGKRSDDGVTETDGMVDGVSPGVKLAFFDAHTYNSQDPNNEVLGIPEDISYLFYFGRQAGARIHSASWGVHMNGEYSEKVRLIDAYFYNDEDDEFIMFAAAGNDGLDGSSTVFDPSLAKNVISVGASHSHGDDLSNNMLGMDYIAAFSSRGPTADDRIKPDIVAPGHSILSAAAKTNECDPSVRPIYDPDNKEHGGVMFMSGTSMSCPIAVGAGTLVRQYFREVYDLPMDISGTLLKAVLINGGEALVGRSKAVYGTDFDTSTQYDEFQGFGRVNLMNSLKHPDIDSPDLHVEDTRVLQEGQTHEYEFKICDSREFRVTIVWKDPPNGAAGCQRCLVNDLDLEVELNEQIYYPNGKSGKDSRNNVERVIIDSSDISNSEQTVYVRVKASNLGYGQVQKYSLASTGCIINADFVTPTPSPTTSCGQDEFEYVLELFTDRQPEDTSWILEYQGSGGIINAGIAGDYNKELNTYIEKGCTRYDCFVFVIRDSNFDGLCCVRGMGSYRITTGDEILVEGDSFRDRQEIEKFCYFGSFTEDPTASPTVVCNDDEFKYQIDIKTDLYPDETRWELRKPRIDGVEPETYTEKYREYQHEGCLDLDACVSFSVYGYKNTYAVSGEVTIIADNFVITERERFHIEKMKEFCYSEETNIASTHGSRTSTVGGISGELFDDEHPLWQYGKIEEIELYSKDAYSVGVDVNFIGITYENGQSFGHGDKDGDQHIIINLEDDQYITKVSGRSDDGIRQLTFETNDGIIFGPYGDDNGDLFEFDFNGNVLFYIFGRADDYGLYQLGFAHASLSPTMTDSPTSQPTSHPCDVDQYRYEIIVRTGEYPEYIWWELYPVDSIVNSVPYMSYQKQFESYSHTGCLTYGDCYEFRIFDKRKDGICCYFGSGSYKLSIGNNIPVQGNHFHNANRVGGLYPDYVFNRHEFCYERPGIDFTPLPTSNPTTNPTAMPRSNDEFEYRIRVRTNFFPDETSWNFTYANNGEMVESVGKGRYIIEYFEYNHRGFVSLNDCYNFSISTMDDGLCCFWGNGGYTIFANGVVVAEGGEWEGNVETKTFCYGSSFSSSPSTTQPSSHPTQLPSLSNQICETGSNNYDYICGYLASIGYCDDLDYKYLMLNECAKACANCCMDYDDEFCVDYASKGYCTNTTEAYDDVTWQDIMQGNCRVSCGTCDNFTPSPTIFSDPVCEPGSNNNDLCGYYASIGWCDDSEHQDWMLDDCTMACANCCMDYEEWCEYLAHDGYCTDTSMYSIYFGITWQEFMEVTCRVSCGTCDITPSPTPSNQICETGSNKNIFCGYWASIGLCDESGSRDWMLENCEVACANCCINYIDDCDDYASNGYCTNTTPYFGGIIWQEWMQGNCRVSCNSCDVEFTPSPVLCSDGEFQYEIVFTAADDDYVYFLWNMFYKYPDLVDGYEIPESYGNNTLYQAILIDPFGIIVADFGLFPPNAKKRYNGCAKYSCFDMLVNNGGYLKVYDVNTGTLIAQNTERAENPRFCHYEPQPTTSPISLLKDAIFTVTLTFSTTSLHQEEIVSSVSYRSIQKILFHAHSFNEESYSYDPFIVLEYSFCEEFKCDVSFRVCNESCDNNEVLQPDFLAFIANTLKEAKANELLLLTLKQTGYHMTVEIFDDLKSNNPIEIEFDFEYEAWPTSSPTTSPSSTPTQTQDCNFPIIIQNLFGFISNILQPITQGINNTISNITSSISDVLFGVDSYNSTDIILCNDKMFQLQLDIVTDGNPGKTSWELLYENGTKIDSVGQNTYSECDTSYNYSYCLDTSCFVFHMFDSIAFQGSYNITVEDNVVLVEQDGFLGWKDTQRFCYPPCDDDGMFALQIDLVTDPWPQETSWQLAFVNGTLIDSVDARYYTCLNTFYTHRYCLYEGCYSVIFQDHIGDGMCCSYGEGSYQLQINNNDEKILLIKEGGKFEESETTTFCYPFDDASCKGCEGEKRSLFEKITHMLLKR